jgi:hypothetical protein
MNLNKEQAVWLVDVFKATAYGRGFKGNVYQNYLEAERILRGWDTTKPRGCSCEFPSLTRMVNSFYDQYEPQIMELYNEPAKKIQRKRPTNKKSS